MREYPSRIIPFDEFITVSEGLTESEIETIKRILREEFARELEEGKIEIDEFGNFILEFQDGEYGISILIYKDLIREPKEFARKYLYCGSIVIYYRDREILVPEVIAQHGLYPTPEEIEEILPRAKVEECRRIARNRDEYIECLDEKYAEMLDKHFEEVAKKVENAPKMRLTEDYTLIEVAPEIVDVKCYLNIPHYHYYLGWIVEVKSLDLISLLRAINNYQKYIDLYKAKFERFVRELERLV